MFETNANKIRMKELTKIAKTIRKQELVNQKDIYKQKSWFRAVEKHGTYQKKNEEAKIHG